MRCDLLYRCGALHLLHAQMELVLLPTEPRSAPQQDWALREHPPVPHLSPEGCLQALARVGAGGLPEEVIPRCFFD